MKTNNQIVIVIIMIMGYIINVSAQMTEDELAKIAQNPLANIISLPIQNNTNYNIGPFKRTQNITNIQPVIPFAEGKFITRIIIPIINQPNVFSENGNTRGIGDITLSAFYASNKGKVSWGVGPIINVPTAAKNLGIKEWGGGPSLVAVIKPGNWVIGALINNVWSFESNQSVFALQPFINYNLPKGYYLSTSPKVTANWKSEPENQWTIPLGLAFGRIIKPKNFIPFNIQAGAYYNIEKPEFVGSDWTLRLSVTALIPKALLKRNKQRK